MSRSVGATSSTIGRSTAQWNGTSWSIAIGATPDGSSYATFFGIDCITSTSCLAVGMHGSGEGPARTLAEGWNGTRWKVVGSASQQPKSTVLTGVSCGTASSCYAVGSTTIDQIHPMSTLVETWNGTGFAIVPTPNPAGSTRNVLQGISCVNATSCTAVGDYEARGSRLTLVERYG